MGSFKVFNRGSKKKEKEKEKKVPGKLSQDIRPNSNISQLKTPPVLAGLLKKYFRSTNSWGENSNGM